MWSCCVDHFCYSVLHVSSKAIHIIGFWILSFWVGKNGYSSAIMFDLSVHQSVRNLFPPQNQGGKGYDGQGRSSRSRMVKVSQAWLWMFKDDHGCKRMVNCGQGCSWFMKVKVPPTVKDTSSLFHVCFKFASNCHSFRVLRKALFCHSYIINIIV